MTPLLPPSVPLERLVRRCALGIRFRDWATQEVVLDGLTVSAYPVGAPLTASTARVNRSGVWAFHGLAGLRGYEFGNEEASDWTSPPGPRRFRVEVEDLLGRFLQCTFEAEVPTEGMFKFMSPASPPAMGPDVPLFSAPSRPVPPGFGVIRTELAMPDGRPAQWALVEAATMVRNQRIRALGVANENGVVLILVPWPEPVGLALASPPGGLSVAGQGWDFEFNAWHDFNEAASDFADLDAVTSRLGRAANSLWLQLSPPVPFHHATLNFGRELIVPDRSFATETSSLIITAA